MIKVFFIYLLVSLVFHSIVIGLFNILNNFNLGYGAIIFGLPILVLSIILFFFLTSRFHPVFSIPQAIIIIILSILFMIILSNYLKNDYLLIISHLIFIPTIKLITDLVIDKYHKSKSPMIIRIFK